MRSNIGTTDRILRIIFAAVIAILFFTGVVSGTVGILLLVLAAILLLTSLIGFCPLYVPFGIRTCRAE